MAGIIKCEPNKEKAKIVLQEAQDSFALTNCAYKKELYKNVIKSAYETMLFLGETIAAVEGLEVRKRDCHLQIENIFNKYKEKYEIDEPVIVVFESIRKLRNFFVHPENHYAEIDKNEQYEYFALLSKNAAETMLTVVKKSVDSIK
jgi:uncharacterized protein (UPF0332 family)